MVAVTGEMKGNGTSSNLRCLYCRISSGDVIPTELAKFQRNPSLFPTALNFFADFIAREWFQVVAFIKTEFPKCRSDLERKIKERRLMDTAICLHLSAELLGQFLTTAAHLDPTLIFKEIQEMQTAILRCVLSNESAIGTEDYCPLFLHAVHHLMVNNEIRLAEERLSLETLEAYDGFKKAGYYFFTMEKIFPKAVTFMRRIGEELPFDLSEMVDQLRAAGIIKPTKNGNGKFVNYARIDVGDKTKHNFIKISIEKFYKTAQIEEGYDEKNS